MGTKKNIRSIRLSDELVELIDQQQGQNFTEKFENLITRCVWELPRREQELKCLEERIKEKRELLLKMSTQAGELQMTLNDLFPRITTLEAGIDRAVKKWDV